MIPYLWIRIQIRPKSWIRIKIQCIWIHNTDYKWIQIKPKVCIWIQEAIDYGCKKNPARRLVNSGEVLIIHMLRNCKISKNQDQRRAQIFCVWRIRIRLLKTFESTCFLSCGKYLNMSHVFTSNNLISEKCKKENNLCKIVGSIFKPVNSYGI